VCACNFEEDSEVKICNICNIPHHKDCWEYAEGCAIFGCKNACSPSSNSGRTNPEDRLDALNLNSLNKWRRLVKLRWYSFLAACTGFLGIIVTLLFLVVADFFYYPDTLGVAYMYFLLLPVPVLVFVGGILLNLILLPGAMLMWLKFERIKLKIPSGGLEYA
jgi:hypothetical protein